MKIFELKKELERFNENCDIVFSQDEEGNGLMKEANLKLEIILEKGEERTVVSLYPNDYIEC